MRVEPIGNGINLPTAGGEDDLNLTGVNLHVASNDHLEPPAAVNLSPVVRNQKATDLKPVKLDSNSLAPEDEEEEQYIEICG